MSESTNRFSAPVTVIVCTRYRPGLLANCLAALAQQTHPDFEVLVVDNAPFPQVRDVCERHGVRYVHEPVAGISRARNSGVRASRSEIVAFIDDDAIADADWLKALVPVFHDPSMGATTGGTRYMKSFRDDRLMSAEIAQEPMRSGHIYGCHEDDWFASASFGSIGDGMNMAFRRSLFASGLRFDDRLGRGSLLDGADEHVAFLSVLAAGYRIAHIPAAVVRHPAPGDPGATMTQRIALLRSSIAYMLFLWFEFPGHRGDLVRFVWRAIHKRLKPSTSGASAADPMSRWQALRAVIGGAIVYSRARRTWTKHRPVGVRSDAYFTASTLRLMSKPGSSSVPSLYAREKSS